MGRRNKTLFGESAWDNNTTYGTYLHRLTELSISMFEWKNLPDTIDERFLELTLFSKGMAVFFEDKELGGYIALPCTISGGFNVYRIPINRRAYAVNGYNRQLDINNSVIIYNNSLHDNCEPNVRRYAKILYNLDRIIEVNANAQKTPVLISGSENQRLSLVNMYKEWDGNAPVVFGDKKLNDAIKSLRTDAPYVCDKLYQLKTQYWNEALTYLGISNLNIQKKERLVSDEVTRSVGGTIASRYSRLNARRQACEMINKMFNLPKKLEVDFREDYREQDDEVMFSGETGDRTASVIHYDLRTK